MGRYARAIFAGLCALALLSGCSSISYTDVREGTHLGDEPNRLEVHNDTYRVGAMDVLQIAVRDNRDLDQELTVRPDGNITFPLLDDVYVENMTPEEISQKLGAELGNFIVDVKTTVTVVGFNSKRVYIFGEVMRQGPQIFTGELTVLDLVANAGGVTIRAAPGRILLVRSDLQEPKVFKIDLDRIRMEGDSRLNFQLREDDIVFVPANVFAKIGYAIDNVLYPFRSLLGAAYTAVAVESLSNR